ncbi:MAG: hypothetical protein ABFC55_09340 [Tenuifilaceae bacterium]
MFNFQIAWRGKSRVNDKGERIKGKGLNSRFKIQELVCLLADFRTCPPTGGFQISDSRTCPPTGGTCPPTGGFQNLSACWRIHPSTGSGFRLVRLLAELAWWFKPRRGVISSKGRSPLFGANDFYKP